MNFLRQRREDNGERQTDRQPAARLNPPPVDAQHSSDRQTIWEEKKQTDRQTVSQPGLQVGR